VAGWEGDFVKPIRKVIRVNIATARSGGRMAMFECGHHGVVGYDTPQEVRCEQCVEKEIDPLCVAWGHVSFALEAERERHPYRAYNRTEFFECLVFAARHAVEYPPTRAGREIKSWLAHAIVNATPFERIAIDERLGISGVPTGREGRQ
jgi:hypothetical protein